MSRLAKSVLLSCLGLLACARGPSSIEKPPSASGDAHGIRLVVQITVDQLRADLPERVLSRVDPGGFKHFYERAVVYDNAHYAHAITETAPGHATLFTGALPKEHGIVGNEWLSTSGRPVPVVADSTQPLVGSRSGGVSPQNLLIPTIGDALRAHTRDRALVVAVSEKDRGAVLPAGKTGRAFWLDDAAGSFVSSSYYLKELPGWMSRGAASFSVGSLSGKRWALMQDAERYSVADDLPSETPGAGEARTFPHVLDATDTAGLSAQAKRTPFADELVLGFVRELLTNEPLGRDDVPDLLAVSFSSTDYVGHRYGPESREAEDNLLRLDRTLAALLQLIDERVGFGRALVILSADHGISESPEWQQTQGKTVSRHDTAAMIADLNRDLRAAFAVELDLVRDFVNPSIWLNEELVSQAGLTVEQVAAKAAELLRAREGVAAAFPRDAVLAGKLDTASLGADGEAMARRVSASVHPERSGHVYVVPKSGWLLAGDATHLTAMHGTPWPHDTHVPIWVLAPGVGGQRVARAVDPRAIAPTIARWLGLAALPTASGKPLSEALPR